MLLTLQLWLRLDRSLRCRPDDPCPSVGQFPIDFSLARRLFGVKRLAIFRILFTRTARHLVETRDFALALQATHTVNDDGCHQYQPEDDQPLS